MVRKIKAFAYRLGKKESTSEPLRLEFSAPVHSLWLRTESLDFSSLYVGQEGQPCLLELL